MDPTSLATAIVQKLQDSGHIAYFAGGCVRDYFMGQLSDDIDIATSATPSEILDLFPHTLLVGISFGVVIVLAEGQQFEVSSFRKDFEYLDGRKPSRIELTDAREDALRRDFTINGMFYDPISHEIFDYVHGVEDIKNKVIRTIGAPGERFLEDRLRMIRAIRFAAKFDFIIEQETHQAIIDLADTLFPAVAKERVWQELLKMATSHRFDFAIIELHRTGLLGEIFPPLKQTHLHDIKEQLRCFKKIPQELPLIIFLNQLFGHLRLDQKKEIFQDLKVSNAELKWVEFQSKVELAGDNLVEWAYVYAHPFWESMQQVLCAPMEPDAESTFFKTHHQRQLKLSSAIQRIKEKRPLISSHFLAEHKVQPGIRMGKLLKSAERISIEQHIDDPQQLMIILKSSEAWRE